MDAEFIDGIRRNIYISKVNGLIPWAVIQRPKHWVGGDPNPGTAIHVDENSSYTIRPGYYYYKQVTRAGQPGMAVAVVESYDPDLHGIAFSSNGTKNPNAFVLINIEDDDKEAILNIKGNDGKTFKAYRTSEEENYKYIGEVEVKDSQILYDCPAGSVTTFFGK